MEPQIHYNQGNFMIRSNSIRVANIQEARTAFSEWIAQYSGTLKHFDERRTIDCLSSRGIWNYWQFKDGYFLRGHMMTLSGKTIETPETYSDPDYMPSGEILCERVDKQGRVIESNRGIKGREALPTDPGELDVTIEGYRLLSKRRKPTMDLLLNCPPPAIFFQE